MWKCGSRRFRDTVERGASQYDKCSSAGINSPRGEFFNQADKKNENKDFPCCWSVTQKCWSSLNKENDTKHKRWNFDHLNRTWIGAIAWSSALMFGWYTSHLIHFNFKKNCREKKKFSVPKVYSLLDSSPAASSLQKSLYKIGHVVYAVSQDSGERSNASNSSSNWTNNSGPVDSELGEVLNSIENRLGLAEIESGHYTNGLNLLRSAANRNHPPALYNLGLCYELGLGVAVDEKVAMNFYRSAASMQHPGALYNLGIYYGQGRGGLPRDSVTAMRLIKLAAVQGQESALAAIKAMEPEAENTNTNDQSNNCNKNDAPTLSSLFIQNLQLQQFNYEPIVF